MREQIPVLKAIILYSRFGTWAKVAQVLRRKDGTTFTWHSIWLAVRRYDRRAA